MISLLLAATLTLAPAADRTPPCEYEDGSGQARCVWDAKHMGNGKGNSILIKHGGTDKGKIIKISHGRAHRLMTTND